MILFIAVLLSNVVCYIMGFWKGCDKMMEEIKRRIEDEERNSK